MLGNSGLGFEVSITSGLDVFAKCVIPLFRLMLSNRVVNGFSIFLRKKRGENIPEGNSLGPPQNCEFNISCKHVAGMQESSKGWHLEHRTGL